VKKKRGKERKSEIFFKRKEINTKNTLSIEEGRCHSFWTVTVWRRALEGDVIDYHSRHMDITDRNQR
jgi:hypothetical protein